MRITLLVPAIFVLCFSQSALAQETDSLIFAEGKVINASTKEPITARITYQSLPYGNRIGVINNSSYSFPMFDGEHYSITVEAAGFAPAKYMLDPATANGDKKVIKDIELSNGTRPNTHVAGHVTHDHGHAIRAGIDPGPELPIVELLDRLVCQLFHLRQFTD